MRIKDRRFSIVEYSNGCFDGSPSRDSDGYGALQQRGDGRLALTSNARAESPHFHMIAGGNRSWLPSPAAGGE